MKCWQFSSSETASDLSGKESAVSFLKGAIQEETAVLGLDWNPLQDMIIFHVA